MVVGQIISLFGNAILRFALAMSVLDLTGSATVFGMISALSMVPMAALFMFGGILADRVSKKNIMVVLDFFTSALLALFIPIFSQSSSLVPIAILLVMLSIIQSFYQPSVQSSIPLLAAEERLMQANGVVAQVNALAALLGPIIGGLLYGFFGIFPILYASLCCFFFSAVMECFLHIPFVKRQRENTLFSMIRKDFSEAGSFLTRRQPGLMKLLLLVAGINLFLSAMIVIGLPYLVKLWLGLSNQLYGFAEASMGVGSILGGLLAGALAKKLEFRRSYVLLLLTGGITVPMGLSVVSKNFPILSYAVLLLSVALIMACATMFTVYGQTIIQKLTPSGLLGKVSSVVTVVSMCAFPLGQGLYGVLFDRAQGLSFLVILFSGAACIVFALLCARVLRHMKLEPEENAEVTD